LYVIIYVCITAIFLQTDRSDKTLVHSRDFRVKHYAGNVTYSTENFIIKNKDTLFQDFKRLMYGR